MANETDLIRSAAMSAEIKYPTSQELEHYKKLEGIFMPSARRRRDIVFKPGLMEAKFVHYTTAEAALSIIRTKRFWMRNTKCMSDYREVQHGFDIYLKFFSVESNRKAFFDVLDLCAPGAALEAVQRFDGWWKSSISYRTYISSLSEHDDDEDINGRLSMWRAIGRSQSRVAIVLKVPAVAPVVDVLNIQFSPVTYHSEDEEHALIREVIENVRANCEYLRPLEPEFLKGLVFRMLLLAVTCLKHKGFQEEREWRAVYVPDISSPSLVEASIETIDGVPQIVQKIPLDKKISPALEDIDFSRVFDRVIIGPSQYPVAMAEAFAVALAQAGIQNAHERVTASGIPIRT